MPRMKFFKLLSQFSAFLPRIALLEVNGAGGGALSPWRLESKQFSNFREEPELKDFMNYLDALKNYEKSGVPKGAGTDSDDGFDLRRMRRLMDRLGNPHSKFKAIHIAGTKGKGSTAAYLSNILRAEGYSVGCYTSPHFMTIRERISVGKLGQPVSAKELNSHFRQIREKLDEAILVENGGLSHFEVLTAVAFSLFAHESIDIAIIEAGLGGARDATNIICSSGLAASVITSIGEEHLMALGGSLESIATAKAGIIKRGCPVRTQLMNACKDKAKNALFVDLCMNSMVDYLKSTNKMNNLKTADACVSASISCCNEVLVLGGPFLPHIEQILRDKASEMCAPVVSASDSGIRTTIKGLGMFAGQHCQLCDIMIRVEGDFQLFIELFDIKLRMLGSHQLRNAATAACVALCLRNQGWDVSDESIRVGLENTYLFGRSQFLSAREAELLGFPGSTVLLDGAHTKESAKALVDTVQMTFPDARLVLLVAMASDKDHVAFAREFLLGKQLEAVFLTEADIAGGKSRTTPASLLRNYWVQASEELGISTLHDGMAGFQDFSNNQGIHHAKQVESRIILVSEESLDTSISVASKFLRGRPGKHPCVIVVTGSLHIVSSAASRRHW